ncbi:TPA: hypothetical protein JLF26_004945, partial [Escherichia coli]|nr:hypothetical protein [Escherichia coli]
LLWVLLAFQSMPASCHVFDFKEGTIEVHDFFNNEVKKIPLDAYGDGTLGLTKRGWGRPGDWDFKFMWKTRNYTGFTFDPYDQFVETSITSMFDFTSTEGVAASDWIDKGTYQFPPRTNTAFGYCRVPQIVESDTIPVDGLHIFENYGSAMGTCDSCGLMATLTVTCTAYYEIRKHVAIKLVDTVINLTGSTPDALSGGTKLVVNGYGGPVTVKIDNPNPEAVSVSFDPISYVSSMNMDLLNLPQYEQQIYVRGNTSIPGRHEYRVQLKAEFK